MSSSVPRWSPSTLFFPAASLYAAIVLPWSVLAMTGMLAGPAALSVPAGHAHEMLLGYALAVVAGNQLPPMHRSRLLALLGTWLAARIAFLVAPSGLGLLPDAMFALVLAWHTAPRLLRAAKKLRNQALPAILLALCAAAVAFDVASLPTRIDRGRTVMALVLLLAALMLFMGGRIIAAGAAGQRYRQGQNLAARVQPRIESALLATMAIAVAAAVIAPPAWVMRAACTAAGALALLRLIRWRLESCERRPDLLCLGAGYAWLALGLISIGGLDPAVYRTAALHAITVGALGTLTFNVMANTTLSKARRPAAREPALVWGTVLIGGAAVLRILAALSPQRSVALLVAAAACWSVAFLVLCVLFAHARPVRSPGAPMEPRDQRHASSDAVMRRQRLGG